MRGIFHGGIEHKPIPGSGHCGDDTGARSARGELAGFVEGSTNGGVAGADALERR